MHDRKEKVTFKIKNIIDKTKNQQEGAKYYMFVSSPKFVC